MIRIRVRDLLFPGIDFSLRKRIKKVKKYLMAGEVKTLDAGCGNGAFSLLCYKLGNSVTGIDINSGNIRRCLEYRDYKGIPGSRVRFVASSIYDLLELNQTFDQILCFETLEHLLHDNHALEIFAKLLNRGGIIHLGVPNLNCPFNFTTPLSRTEDGGHVRKGYTYPALRQMLTGLGLEVLREDSYGGFFTQKVTTLYYRLQKIYLFKNYPRPICDARNVLAFLCLNPLTYLDNCLESEPMSIYITAKKV